ncbi:MAG: YecA family protein [Acidimicrobiales bacterium]
MDADKTGFLFGEIPDGFDIDDADDRAALLAVADDEPLAGMRSAVRVIVAEQILQADPPQVWETAQRLLGLGLDRRSALAQLAMALEETARSALAKEDGVFPTDRYTEALASLPLPDVEEIEAAILDAVRTTDGATADEVDRLVMARLGRRTGEGPAQALVDRVFERLIEDDGTLALLAGDQVVDVDGITSGIVLTHRLSEVEHELGMMRAGFDLAGFARRRDLHLADGSTVVALPGALRQLNWHGPDGWLASFAEGSVLAVRVDRSGLVTLDSLSEQPPPDPELVALVRSVYDDAVDEPWLPVAGEELVLGALRRNRRAFSGPRAPLDDLCAAAGLERRQEEVAHEDSVWEAREQLWRVHHVYDTLDDADQQRAALRVLETADDDEPSSEALRDALKALADPDVREVVLDELDEYDRLAPFAEALVAAARRPVHIGVARLFATLVAELSGEPLVAEAHLRTALDADPSSAEIVERCAWYASDRGNAAEAVRLLRQLDAPDRSDAVRALEPFARRTGPKLGRNDRCWCGSGRKFKACHIGQQPTTPLPDRVGWLCRKAAAYMEHAGAEARDALVILAECRAVAHDRDSLLEAMGDAIVLDAALTEWGWFDRFLASRGPLLPEDELLLAESWLFVARTVYEIVAVDPGTGLQVRDLRSGDVLHVRERTLSQHVQTDSFVCARAVPDGETHQFVGAVLPVAPGRETDVLDLCDEEDAEALCEYAAVLQRPPKLETREGEPLMDCRAILDVPDSSRAADILDAHYTREGDAWVDLHAIDVDEEIVRGTLTLTGSRLEMTTNSEPRVERMLGVLLAALPGACVVSDERVPFVPGSRSGATAPPLVLDPDIVEELQDRFERQWVDESVPALAGLTPRQASEDPTRRDELRRLIASFPGPEGLPPGAMTMRPDRLRELLGL